MVKGMTKSGINYEINENVVKDMRLVFYASRIESDKTESKEKIGTLVDMLSFVFGSEDNTMAFMNEVAKAHDGVCTTKDTMFELNEIFASLNAKN